MGLQSQLHEHPKGIVGAGARVLGHSAGLLAAAMLLASSPARALDILELAPSVSRINDGQLQALSTKQTIDAGDRVRTNASGRLAMRLGSSRLTLGGDSILQVHSVDPANALARLILEQGSLRIDTRGARPTEPGDIRLNVGDLRLRILGADVWAADGGRTEVCLVAGAVEMQTPWGPRRLDEPGSCLSVTDDHHLRVLNASAAGSLARRLAGTSMPGEYQRQVAESPADAPTPPAMPERAPQPAVAAVDPAPAAPASGDWGVVIASLTNADEATRYAADLNKRGLQARVVRNDLLNGGATFRVVAGRYRDEADARDAQKRIRAMPGMSQAWLLHDE